MATEPNPYAPPAAADQPDAAAALAVQVEGPRGIGGWLVLPLLGLVFTPIMIAVTTARDFLPVFQPDTWGALTTPGSEAYHPLWMPLLVFELAGNVAMIAFDLVILVLFIKHSHRVPRLMIILLLVTPAFLLTDHVLAQQIPALAAQPELRDVKEIVRSCIGAMIWIPYFQLSKRVRNTFVR